jgi:hypothetical protein
MDNSGEYQENNSFAGVVFSYLCRLTELSFANESIDYTCDILWASIYPYIENNDRILEDYMKFTRTPDPYQNSIGKVKSIGLSLYTIGLFPAREYRNRQYDFYVSNRKESRSEQVTDNLDMRSFYARHMVFLSAGTRKQLDIRMMMDVQWALLSAYITEEDAVRWQEINETYFKPNSMFYDPYISKIEHMKVIASVMDRADFLLRTGRQDLGRESSSEAWRSTMKVTKTSKLTGDIRTPRDD